MRSGEQNGLIPKLEWKYFRYMLGTDVFLAQINECRDMS